MSRHGPEVDWSGLRRRLEAAGSALAGETERTPEEAGAVLDERARMLARPAAAADPAGTLEVLTFSMGAESYAVEARFVVAAFRLAELAPVPGAEAPLVGVAPWRGEILPLLDLRVLTGGTALPTGDAAWVVVLGEEQPAFGVLVSELRDTGPVPLAAIVPPPDGVAGGRKNLRGITREAVLVLDAEGLLRTYIGGSVW